jgi:hypothetical protein
LFDNNATDTIKFPHSKQAKQAKFTSVTTLVFSQSDRGSASVFAKIAAA